MPLNMSNTVEFDKSEITTTRRITTKPFLTASAMLAQKVVILKALRNIIRFDSFIQILT